MSHASVYSHVRVIVPPRQASVSSVSTADTVPVPSQLSVQVKSGAVDTSEIQVNVTSLGGFVNIGASVSIKVIFWV